MKALLKKMGIYAVTLDLLEVANLETANAAISINTELNYVNDTKCYAFS